MKKKNKMSNKKGDKITIDKLAIMMNNSFEGLEKKMATKDDINSVKEEIKNVKNQLEGTNKRIDDFAETKVSKIVYKELENRVGFIEKKLEIKNS